MWHKFVGGRPLSGFTFCSRGGERNETYFLGPDV